MAVYNPSTDKVLVKVGTGGYGDGWSPDIIASILVASNVLDAVMSDAAPGDTNKLWFDPDSVTPAAGIYKIYDVATAAWVPLTPLRFMQWIVRRGGAAIPTGSVQAYMGAASPSGWLLCNGAAVSRATYADLYAVVGTTFGPGDGSTTFNLPDLRGEFLRGADAGRGVDPARTLGSAQADGIKAHTHLNGIADNNGTGANTPIVYGAVTTDMPGNAQKAVVTNIGGPPTYQGLTSSTGGQETRPRNVAVTYIIKV